MTSDVKATGGCMCGSVRYEAVGEPKFILNCHCLSCRRHTGAPVVTFVAFSSEQVRFVKGSRKFYKSSPGVNRAFCGQCGTPLTWEAPSPRIPGLEIIEFHISTLDHPDDYHPDRHFFGYIRDSQQTTRCFRTRNAVVTVPARPNVSMENSGDFCTSASTGSSPWRVRAGLRMDSPWTSPQAATVCTEQGQPQRAGNPL